MGFLGSLGRVFAGVTTGGLSELFLNKNLAPVTAKLLPAGGTALGSALGGPVGGALGGAVGSGLGSMFNQPSNNSSALAYMNALGAQQQNEANAHQAQLNRDFQERMSSTAHQREIADLKAAGLNPILSANGGSSSPSGSMAIMTNAASPGVDTALKLKDQAIANQGLMQSMVEIMSKVALNASQSTLNLSNSDLVKTKTTEGNYFNLGIDQFMKHAQNNPDLNLTGKNMAETSSAQQTNYNLASQQKQMEAYTELLQSQTLTEASKRNLQSADISLRLEELKTLRQQGTINDTQFGYAMGYLKKLVDTVGPVLPWFAPKFGPRTSSP
ncbi:MAG: DNA pilot protein [Microviridae sp.]|nr:MAG: DNA pilot protein [Microviridae sp.]